MLNFVIFVRKKVLLAVLSVAASAPIVNAQTVHNHHHPIIGIDELEVFQSGDYAGLENPNYERLSIIYVGIHQQDITTSHFHAIGSYSYSGSIDNPTVVETNQNNQIPEYWTELAPNKLLPGEGVFADKLVSKDIGEMYSNLVIKPVKHLEADLDEDQGLWYAYNSEDKRWSTTFLGDAEIALELVDITPGLGVATTEGTEMFSSEGDTYIIGQGDDFAFTPVFYTSPSEQDGDYFYSATFKLLDVNTEEGNTPFASSGTFTFNFQASVPEPSAVFGLGLLSGFALIKKYRKGTC